MKRLGRYELVVATGEGSHNRESRFTTLFSIRTLQISNKLDNNVTKLNMLILT
jgi:hypothetical protein